MGKLIDLTNQKFGKLTPLKYDKTYINSNGKNKPVWWCQCDCGNPELVPITSTHLNSGHTTSCGNCPKYENIGREMLNNQRCLMKIIRYDDYKHLTVEFQDKYKAHVDGTLERFESGKIRNPNYRLGLTNVNKQGCLMEIVKYNTNMDLFVEFDDDSHTIVHTDWRSFTNGTVRNPNYRINVIKINKQGYLMKCILYNSYSDILVEFQDKYKAIVHTSWSCFEKNTVRNPYEPNVFKHGMIGNKYPSIDNNGKTLKETRLWRAMIARCFSAKFKIKNPTYENVTICEEWLLYENFYEWIHSQENFDKWLNGDKYLWALDKDILIKGNKEYSPNACSLVPIHVNGLFAKNNKNRGELPIGVSEREDRGMYMASIVYGKKDNKSKTAAYAYPTPEDAFYLGYKPAKEAYIKQIAQEEFDKGNITKKCYEAMMKYEVEITD